MKVTLDIEDNKAAFLIELLSSLDYVTIDTTENFEVPEWQQEIVLERVNDPSARYINAKEFFEKLDKKIL